MTQQKISYYDISWEKGLIKLYYGDDLIETLKISAVIKKQKYYDWGNKNIPKAEKQSEIGYIERYIVIHYDYDEIYEYDKMR